jgi:hypothetical protein
VELEEGIAIQPSDSLHSGRPFLFLRPAFQIRSVGISTEPEAALDSLHMYVWSIWSSSLSVIRTAQFARDDGLVHPQLLGKVKALMQVDIVRLSFSTAVLKWHSE